MAVLLRTLFGGHFSGRPFEFYFETRYASPYIRPKPVFERVDLEQYLEEHDSNPPIKISKKQKWQIFKNALDFSKVKARECMIPRNEIVAMELNDDINLLREKFVTGFLK